MLPWPMFCRCWISTTIWWWHLTPLARSSIPLNKVWGECGQVWSELVATGSDTPVRVSMKDSARACGGDETRLFLWRPEPWMQAHVGPQSRWWTSCKCRNWKDGQKIEIPCSQRLPWLEDQILPDHRHWGTCIPLRSWRAITPSCLDLL